MCSWESIATAAEAETATTDPGLGDSVTVVETMPVSTTTAACVASTLAAASGSGSGQLPHPTIEAARPSAVHGPMIDWRDGKDGRNAAEGCADKVRLGITSLLAIRRVPNADNARDGESRDRRLQREPLATVTPKAIPLRYAIPNCVATLRNCNCFGAVRRPSESRQSASANFASVRW